MLGLSNKGSREIDRMMIEDYGLSGIVLMEEAALGIYSCLASKYNLENKLIYIFVGKGNNGGDGLALARILYNMGCLVKIVLIFNEGLSQEAAAHLNVAKKMGIDIKTWGEEMDQPDIIIDAILGTGFSGELDNNIGNAVKWINNSRAYKVAVDIPTGMNGDTGTGSLFVNSDITIALGYLKMGHLISDKLKSVYLAKLQFAHATEDSISEEDKLHYLTLGEAKTIIPIRDLDSHKGTYGRVGILCGQKEMLGAGLLAGKSALRTGCGLVTLWLENLDGVLGLEPELMLETWTSFLNKELDVLIIGPGLGKVKNLDLEYTLKAFKGKVVIDADGLYWLKMGWIKREWISGEVVLTPHPKEMEMLLGEKLSRRESVIKAALDFKGIAIIKGYRTLISDGKRVGVNLTGNPGMATAGSGDVLAGIIGSLLAQGLGTYEAVTLGTFIHGLSGDLGALRLGYEGLIASDIINYLPMGFSRIKNIVNEKGLVVKIF